MAKTYDVVIVGAGLSGFAAAARAADKNLTTLLLEKSAHTGGSGNYVEGVFAAGSTIQKAAGVHVDQQAVLQTELDYSHYEANHDMWRKYIAQSGQNIDWLQAHGVQFTGVATLGKGSQTWHLFAGHGAQAIHQGLEPFVQRAGVTITTAVDITSITKDDDQFTIAFTHQQQIITVTAKNVILATGGYLNNPAMMDHTAPTGKNTILPMNAGKSHGDGLKFAWKLGAQPFFTGMKMRFGAQLADPNVPPYKLWGATLAKLVVRAQPLLWVNESGDRFVNEDHVIDNWSSQGNVINRQERVFVILDQAMIDQLSTTKLIKKMHFDYSHQTIPELK